MTLGQRIKRLRKEQGLSQERVARAADISLNVFNRLETGAVTNPHFDTVLAIADALGVSVAELIGEPVLTGKDEAPEEEALRGSENLSEEELAALIYRLGARLREETIYPEAATTIPLMNTVCKGIEYRMGLSTYTLEGALYDRAEVLSTLRHCRALKRGMFADSEKVAPGQREALEQLEDRLKEVRNKQREILGQLREVAPNPGEVIDLSERLGIPELEREERELGELAG
jgi:transcriptional regulator with XRE-family HTH domain